ncbi:MAG: hypothetical protein PVG65_01985 [Candidatus Thorarchaeota archaeon]|jgi:hypothetical protein
MITFEERAVEMGLQIDAQKGIYSYNDKFGSVLYRKLKTFKDPEKQISHETDNFEIPALAVFTKPPTQTEDGYMYCGLVSRIYKFVGNEVLNNLIKKSISDVGLPIIKENTILSWKRTYMRNELTIRNGVTSPKYGDILPVMVIKNTYDGTGAQSIRFGLNMSYDGKPVTFAFTLGEMRQIHVAGASTVVKSAVGDYVQGFTENILDMINQSFNNKISEDELFSVLDVVENLGKKRREEVVKILQEMMPKVQEGQPVPLPSAWQVFLAIVRYSSLEPNLNVKSLLEDAAQSVLVIPTKMLEMLKKLEHLE